jgi:hypothetical protein
MTMDNASEPVLMWNDLSTSGGCTTCSSIWFTSASFASASVGIPFSISITTFGGTVTKITRKGALTQGWEVRLTGNGAATLLGTPGLHSDQVRDR